MKVLVLLFIIGPLMTHCVPLVLPLDCSDIYYQNKRSPSGVYTIYPVGGKSAVQVYCDLNTVGGRWTVFQRRMDGSVNFYRPWEQYKMGLVMLMESTGSFRTSSLRVLVWSVQQDVLTWSVPLLVSVENGEKQNPTCDRLGFMQQLVQMDAGIIWR
ncbi:hypothetical protein Q5P01_023129 [Channa striata]|uniref:Fibrinogen C-terminal domain-containing protein n=1 Tax=Channa striata TaxID=64152 RepID=A0AA88IUB4_CHASR|nr:hypothetical protein Q5P01_023129 [Channa striata]